MSLIARFASCLNRGKSLFALLALTAASANAGVVLSGGGLSLVEQGGTFAASNLAGISAGAIPFSSSDLGPELSIPFHVAANINDEIYGNSNSWIGGGTNPYPRPFIGVAVDGTATLQSIAFGRDNSAAPLGDRALGLYELQYTTTAFPDATTLDSSWTTIGTLDYQSASGGNFSLPHLRHRYNFDPIANVTGVRLLVPATGIGGGTAIDELELYETPGVLVPPPPNVVLTLAPAFAIGYNGNNGPYVATTPAPVPDNLALASNGAIPFSSSALGPQLGLPFHVAANVNDGQYGNAFSWIGGDGDATPFVGVAFDGPVEMDRIAWSRDNGDNAGDCCGGLLVDRALGLYDLQFTRVANPDGTTPETGNPLTGWASLATVDYRLTDPGIFDPWLRHEFIVRENGSPILATGFRLRVPLSGLAGGTAIDEIEVYGTAVPEPSTCVLAFMAATGLALSVKRRNR